MPRSPETGPTRGPVKLLGPFKQRGVAGDPSRAGGAVHDLHVPRVVGLELTESVEILALLHQGDQPVGDRLGRLVLGGERG